MDKKQIIRKEVDKIIQNKIKADVQAKVWQTRARQNKDYQKHDNQARKIQIEISKISATDKKIKDLNFQYIQERDKARECLTKMGIDWRNLQPKYNCRDCNDTGYVNNTMCSCLKSAVQKELTKYSGINSKVASTFEQADKNIINSNVDLTKAYKLAHIYIEEFPKYKYPNLVFMGNVGNGKTFLLECIANKLIEKGHYVVFATAWDINNAMLKSINSPFEERDEILSPLLDSELLIIDDLGSEPILKNISISTLYTILNERQRKNLPSIISTNLTPNAINERYGDRLVSRMFNKRNALVIPFNGKDMRLNN